MSSRAPASGARRRAAIVPVLVSLLLPALPAASPAQGREVPPPTNVDVRVNATHDLAKVVPAGALNAKSLQATRTAARVRSMSAAAKALTAAVPGAEVQFSDLTGSAEVVRGSRPLTAAAPGKSGTDVALDFVAAHKDLYGLSAADVSSLENRGESLSRRNGLRMVRLEQVINGIPVFQSETRFLVDREGRLVRSVGLMVPDAESIAPPLDGLMSADAALAAAARSFGFELPAVTGSKAKSATPVLRTTISSPDPRIPGEVDSWLVYFPASPGVLVPAWAQIIFTTGDADWYSLVDARTGVLLWRKNIRDYASTQQARFSVYVQPDGVTPADSPAPQSPSPAAVGGGTQYPEIARTIVNMLSVQDPIASPDGWIPDGGTTTTGNNVDACVDRVGGAGETNVCDIGTIDNNGRPIGNPDGSALNRDFLGAAPRNFNYSPAPVGGNPNAGDDPTGTGATQITFRRGAVTQLFYITNWYHDQLYELGFDEAAGNFQTTNFSGMGAGGDAVRAEAQDSSSTNNANFSTAPDGGVGRMQMFRFTGPTPDRDGTIDAEIVMHELTHGTSNRLIGNAAGLNWDPGRGMGEGWSDFYATSLLNHTNADDPDANYASGAYATYQFAGFGLTDNYVYGIRRFPYSTDNSINPLTWADVDSTTNDLSGGIPTSPIPFNPGGALEVHNVGEIWALSLWEMRSRIIADPAGANGDVPTGNLTALQLVTDALKMTPISPSFIDARDALFDADCATNACANEQWIWEGFADRGLGYKAVSPLGKIGASRVGVGGSAAVGESFSVPYLDVASYSIDDSLGNNNGALDPGEPIRLTVTLTNPWRAASKAVAAAAAILSTSTTGVVILDPASAYGAIAPQGTAAGDTFLLTVAPSVACGSSINFTIQTTSSLGTTSATFSVRVGAPSGTGAPVTYTHSAVGLAIPDGNRLGVTDTFNVPDDLEIADLDVRLDDITHTFTGDLTIDVKGPTGYGAMLAIRRGVFISVANSDGDNFTNTVFDDDLDFTDETVDLNLTDPTQAPFTGSWLPAFNSPTWALFGITNFTADTTGQLSRFDGTSTLGNWKLHLADLATPDAGTLNSWSLIVTPRAFACVAFAPAAALSATKTVSGTFQEGGAVTYTVTITNTGTATQLDNAGHEFTDVLPAGVVLGTANATSGTASTSGNTVFWDGSLAAVNGSVTITITATIAAGTNGTTVSNQGTLSYDGNNDNVNEAAGVTDDPGTPAANDPTVFQVTAGALITATKTDSGNRAEKGSVTYTVVLTNSGGNQADNAGNEFTDVLPSSLTLVSANATSGVAVANTGTNTVTWNGAIPSGGSVTITIQATIHDGTFNTTITNQGTVSFDSNGDLTNDASATTNDPDTAAAGDATSFVVGASSVIQIPTLSELGAACLALLLAAIALIRLRS